MEDDFNSMIERLQAFIDSTGLTTTQFADKTGISRPSLSQILHGRNKSINDLVLRKLNLTFPELNVVWLLFGRGNMRLGSNIEISEPQNSPKSGEYVLQGLENELDEESDDGFTKVSDSVQNRNFGSFYSPNSQERVKNEENNPSQQVYRGKSESSVNSSSVGNDRKAEAGMTTDLVRGMIGNSSANSSRRIERIIVFYSDNSFECFEQRQ